MMTLQERVHKAKPKEQWLLNKIHHVLTVRGNNKNKGMPENNLLSLSYGRIVNKSIDTSEGLLPESFETYQIVQAGDIVMRLTDLQNDKRSIRQGLVKEKGIITSAYDAVYPRKGHDSRFWAYALLALDLAKYYYSLGGGVRQSIKFKDFPNDWIYTPPTETQKEIADFLDRETAHIDQLIEKKKLLNSILYLKEKTALRNLLVDIDAKKWRLRHIGKMKNGAGFPTELQGNHNEEVAFFKVKHLRTFGLDNPIRNSEDTISRDMAKNLRASIFPKGTIVFAKIGAALFLARFATLGREACIDNNMAAFVPKETLINSEFLLLALTQIDMNIMAQPGTVPSLNTESFNNFRVPLPSIEQQISLVAEFRSIRNPILAALNKNISSIEKLREFRTSLITEAVTGQLDIESWKKRGNTDMRLDNIEEAMRT